jgi:site-specific recombinase XerC
MHRVTIAPGIYRDPHGHTARVSCGTGRNKVVKQERFGLDAPMKEMQDWQARERVKLIDLTRSNAKTGGTFDTDILDYLRTADLSDATRVVREQQLGWWANQPGDDGKRLGRRRRYTLKSQELQRAWGRLDTDNPFTLNLYRTAIGHLWSVLDGKNAPNPVRDLARKPEPDALPRGVGYNVVRLILKYLPSKFGRKTRGTEIRLRVFAFAPVTPAQIKLIQPGDLHLDDAQPWMLVRGRRKGRGAPPRAKPLLPEAVAALRDFVACDLFGRFDVGVLRRGFKRARTRAAKELRVDLSAMRMYDLRHSFGSMLFAATGNEGTVGKMLDHTSARTTARYTMSAVPAHLADANAAAAALLAALLPEDATATAKRRRKGFTVVKGRD